MLILNVLNESVATENMILAPEKRAESIEMLSVKRRKFSSKLTDPNFKKACFKKNQFLAISSTTRLFNLP